jgi:hypothetical protein
MSRVTFQCFFCGEGIEEMGYDPCVLVLGTNWTGPPPRQREQQFWCHADCLRAAAHRSVPLYTLDAEVHPAQPEPRLRLVDDRQ